MRTGQILQFPLSRGLEEDTSVKAKPLAALKTGNNIRWPKSGVIGKRFGTRKLGGFTTVSRFLPRGKELAVVNTSGVVQVYDSVNDTVSAVTSTANRAQLEWSTIVDDNQGVAVADCAISGSLLVQAWISGDPTRKLEATPAPDGTSAGNIYIQIVNWRTGQVVMSPVRTAGGAIDHVRVLISGTKAFVFYSIAAFIYVAPYDLVTLAAASPQQLASDRIVINDHAKQGRFDALFRANGNMVLVYERLGTSASSLRAVRWTLSGTTFSSAATVDLTDGTYTDAIAVAIAEDTAGSQIMIVHSTTTTVRLRSCNSTTMVAAGAVTSVATTFYASHVTVAVTALNTCVVGWSGYAIPTTRLPSMNTEQWTCSSGSVAAVALTHRRSMSCAFLSRLFTLGGTMHVFACDGRDAEDDGSINSRTTFPSTYLVKVPYAAYSASIDNYPPHVLAGKIDHDIGGVFQGGCLPAAPAVDSNTVIGVVPFQASAEIVSYNWRTGLRLVQATQDATLMVDPWRSVTVGQESYVVGGYFGAWDGNAFFDYGMRAPVLVLLQDTASGGHIANGSYIYQFEPGYRSRAGVLHRGPLSDQIVSVIGSGPSASVSIKLCSHGLDGKQTETSGFGNTSASRAYLNAFRTEANGAVLYQLTMPPRYNVFPNTPTATTIDFTDTAWDSDLGLFGTESPNPGTLALSTRPEPYPATGELEDCQPPASSTSLLHGGRIFLVIGDKRTIWYSKDYRENPGVAPGFNPSQIELYDQAITALASLDEKRIVFWERGLWYVVGDGPSVSGSDNRFSAPILIQSDVGCDNPRSVVTTPMGVIFQSDADLYMLERNLVVSWLGKAARDTLASYPVITSAVLVSAENEVRFTCNNSGGTAGVVLVFDYERATWFTRTYPTGGGIADAVMHQGVYYLATNSEVRYEDTTVNYDVISSVNTFVASTVELEHLGPSAPIGWQRVRIAKMLGQSLGNHAITMSIARDFATSYEQTETFDAGSAVTTPSGHMRAEVALTVQRRQSVGIKLTDAAPANTTLYPIGNGAGFQLEGIALLVQPKPGLPRDTSSRRGG